MDPSPRTTHPKKTHAQNSSLPAAWSLTHKTTSYKDTKVPGKHMPRTSEQITLKSMLASQLTHKEILSVYN